MRLDGIIVGAPLILSLARREWAGVRALPQPETPSEPNARQPPPPTATDSAPHSAAPAAAAPPAAPSTARRERRSCHAVSTTAPNPTTVSAAPSSGRCA